MPRYAIVVEQGKHNYCAYVPDVDGVVATGATLGEVIDSMRDALEFHLEGLALQGLPLPQPSSIAATVDVDYPTTVAAPHP